MGNYGGLALGIVGGVVGAFFGVPWLGYAVGSLIGGALFPPELEPMQAEGPRLNDGRIQSGAYGDMLPILAGHPRSAGKLIWSRPRLETATTTTTDVGGGGGKGGPPSQQVQQTVYTYSQSFAVAVCDNPIIGIRKIWANAKLVYNVGTGAAYETYIQSKSQAKSIRIYTGSETQTADPLIAGFETVAPAYRGVSYIVFDTLQLAQFGNAIPNLEFEVVTAGSEAATWDYIDTQDQLGFAADGSISADGLLLMWRATAFSGSPTAATISLVNPFTMQILRNFDTSPFLGGDIPGQYAPLINPQGDIIFQDNSSGRVWMWPAGGIPQIVGLGNSTRMSMDNSGNFYVLTQINGGGTIALIRVKPGGIAYDVLRQLPGGIPRDTFNGGDGFLYISYQFGGNGFIEKISASGGLIKTFSGPTVIPQSIAVGGDGSVWYLTGGSGIDQELWRVAPDFSAQTKIFDENGTHTGATSERLARDWGNGDILYVDGAGLIFRRFNEDGVIVRTLTGGPRVFRMITHPQYPERIYGFNPVSPLGGVNRVVATAREAVLTSGTVTVGATVSDLCQRVGMSPADIDVSALTDELRGYVITNRGSVRGMMLPLMQAFQFDYVESGTQLKFVKRGGAIAATIVEDDLGARFDSADAIDPAETTRTQEPELPHEVAIRYWDNDADYQVSTQYSRRLVGRSENDIVISLPIVMTANEAKRCADILLYDAWASRSRRTVAVSAKYALLEPTDSVDLALAEGTVTARIVNKTEQGTIELQTAGTDPTLYSQAGMGGAAPGAQGQVGSPSPTNLVLLDTGLLQENDDTYGFYATAAGYTTNWPGAKLFRSADNGTSYSDAGISFTTPGAIGFSIAPLANFSGGNVFDEVDTVDISLSSGTLASTTELAVLNGANVAWLGGELIQFKTATLLTAGVYRLSGILRGRQGTEWAMQRHKASDVFALLTTDMVRRYNQQSSDVGVTRLYKGVTYASTVDIAAPKTMVLAANCIKPVSPVQVTGSRDGSNNVTYTWIRRARKAKGWLDLVDVALDETTESYETDVFAGTAQNITAITRSSDGVFTTGVHGYIVGDKIYIRAVGGMIQVNERPFNIATVPTTSTFTVGEDTSGYSTYTSGGQVRKRGRTIASSTPTSSYTAANQTTDYGSAQNPIYAVVYQMSSRIGRGYPGVGVV